MQFDNQVCTHLCFEGSGGEPSGALQFSSHSLASVLQFLSHSLVSVLQFQSHGLPQALLFWSHIQDIDSLKIEAETFTFAEKSWDTS